MKPVLPSPHASIVDDQGRPTPEFYRLLQALLTPSEGWTTATGTASRATFATGSVTTEQLAQRVKALLDDLRSRGTI